jgi:hypothetical protein
MGNMILNYLWALPLAVTLVTVGCGTKENTPDRWIGKEYNLTAEAIYPEKEIWMPIHFIQTEEHFIFKQISEGREFSVFHLKGDSLKYDGAFLTYGRGPHEVMDALTHYIPQHNSVVVTGINPVGKSIVIPVDDITNLFTYNAWREYDYSEALPEIVFFTRAVDTVSYILPIHNDEERMLAMVDMRQSPTLTPLDVEYPEDTVVPEPWEKIGRAYGGITPISRPWHKEQFAYSLQHGHYVAIYTLDGNLKVVDKKVVFDELPDYSVDITGNIRVSGKVKTGLSMSVSENYIYLCDTNITLENYRSTVAQEKNGYPSGYSKTIYVCDWEGNPVVKYELDRAVAYCSTDKNDEYLYAFAFDAETLESEIVRFRLPDLK